MAVNTRYHWSGTSGSLFCVSKDSKKSEKCALEGRHAAVRLQVAADDGNRLAVGQDKQRRQLALEVHVGADRRVDEGRGEHARLKLGANRDERRHGRANHEIERVRLHDKAGADIVFVKGVHEHRELRQRYHHHQDGAVRAKFRKLGAHLQRGKNIYISNNRYRQK